MAESCEIGREILTFDFAPRRGGNLGVEMSYRPSAVFAVVMLIALAFTSGVAYERRQWSGAPSWPSSGPRWVDARGKRFPIYSGRPFDCTAQTTGAAYAEETGQPPPNSLRLEFCNGERWVEALPREAAE